MKQRQYVEHLIQLSRFYVQGAKVLQKAEHGFAASLAELFDYKPPIAKNSFVGRSRVDLAHTCWADVHHVLRGVGKPFMKELRDGARKQPDNRLLAAFSKVAEDMYSAFDSVYAESRQVENRFKTRMRGEKSKGEDFRHNWEFMAGDELENDVGMQQAQLHLDDALFNDLGELYSQWRAEERQGTLVADYGEEFPDISDDQLLDAVILGENSQPMVFMSERGLKGLSYYPLQQALKQLVSFREALLEIVGSRKGEAVFSAIAALDRASHPSLERVRELVLDARERINELDVKLPSAARQLVAQQAGKVYHAC